MAAILPSQSSVIDQVMQQRLLIERAALRIQAKALAKAAASDKDPALSSHLALLGGARETAKTLLETPEGRQRLAAIANGDDKAVGEVVKVDVKSGAGDEGPLAAVNGQTALEKALEAQGVDIEALDLRAQALLRARGALLDRLQRENVRTLADVKALTKGDPKLAIEGVRGLKADDGTELMGAALKDGRILLDSNLESSPKALREAALEAVAERTFQDIVKMSKPGAIPGATADGFSQGDFGAEVFSRIAGDAAEVELSAFRTLAETDTVTIGGIVAEALRKD